MVMNLTYHVCGALVLKMWYLRNTWKLNCLGNIVYTIYLHTGACITNSVNVELKLEGTILPGKLCPHNGLSTWSKVVIVNGDPRPQSSSRDFLLVNCGRSLLTAQSRPLVFQEATRFLRCDQTWSKSPCCPIVMVDSNLAYKDLQLRLLVWTTPNHEPLFFFLVILNGGPGAVFLP